MKPILAPPNVIISNCSLLKEENPRQMLSHLEFWDSGLTLRLSLAKEDVPSLDFQVKEICFSLSSSSSLPIDWRKNMMAAIGAKTTE